jgi:hypothetical protein
MTPAFTLVLALLTVQGSYSKNTEKPAASAPDTIQFWLTPGNQWRIRTYAMDHDIHVYSLGSAADKKVSADFAIEHIKKHYTNLTASVMVLTFNDPKDRKEVQRVLEEHHLKGSLEISKSGVAFYNPDNGEYRTKSTPE